MCLIIKAIMKNIFLICSVLFVLSGFAQDTIYSLNGNKHIGKVTEINSKSVKYILAGTEAIVEQEKSGIAQINFYNGSKEVYNVVLPKVVQKEDISYYANQKYISSEVLPQKVYGKNILAINFFEMLFTNLGVSYERVLGNGSFSVKVPFALGLGARPNEHNYDGNNFSVIPLQNKIYSTGLELNLYPGKQTRSTFYIGLSGNYSEFNYFRYGTNPYPSPYPPINYKYTGKQYSGMIHLGGYIGLTDNILLGGKIAMGFKREETINVDYTMSRVQFDFNLAYRFNFND